MEKIISIEAAYSCYCPGIFTPNRSYGYVHLYAKVNGNDNIPQGSSGCTVIKYLMEQPDTKSCDCKIKEMFWYFDKMN